MLVAQPIPRCGYIFQQLRLYHLEAVVAERLFQDRDVNLLCVASTSQAGGLVLMC